MRTKIKIHSNKVSISCTENTSIDEAWNLWMFAVREKNKECKQLFEIREKLLLEYGNQSRMSNDIQELKELIANAKGYKDIIYSSEDWNQKELVCSDNLGNKLYLENFEVKNHEKRIEQINSLINTIETKIELLKPGNQEPKQTEINKILDVIKSIKRKELTSILKQLENERTFKEANKQQFAAIAKIIYDKDLINRKKCSNFKKWMKVFSEYYEREISTYKENDLKTAVNDIKIKYPFLEHTFKDSFKMDDKEPTQ